MCDNVLVVLNYNDFETTSEFIKKIQDYSSIDRIIVVDNNSTDNSFTELSKYKSNKIDVISTLDNLGYAYGNNIGMKYAEEKYKPKYFIISNPDVFFDESIIFKMNEVIKSNNDIALVAPKMKSVTQPTELAAWKLPSFWLSIASDFIVFNRIFEKRLQAYDVKSKGNLEVEVLPGSLFMADKEKIKAVNYFDDRTFLYCEENILAHRLICNGYKNVLMTDIEYIHEHSKSIDKNIKSLLSRYKILQKSKIIYYKYYLNRGIFSIILASIFFYFSQFEKVLISILKRSRKDE